MTRKLGDAVVITTSGCGYNTERLGKVIKVTPTGQMVVSSEGKEYRFNKHGRLMGESGGWTWTNLKDATTERLARIEYRKLYDKIKAVFETENKCLAKLTLDNLRTIANVIDSMENRAKIDDVMQMGH